ncbi:uncharacterized protein B0I36DRAFT_327741 [Microdochium trichocladiopsis]|uniref:Uncharacterized protein n=1 Tax=Microdochium trichocladiopsis TaxID=1682393 RepID=A0A9P8Y2J8_9PEZI|nr:uncharacterized protein B0I36DRAFT_327741 [Microdochium trichocladiopsis]KAH7027723.1 hypothetical protein B0I36DRAFT_327741 [Microdochium trichocladiopsis]
MRYIFLCGLHVFLQSSSGPTRHTLQKIATEKPDRGGRENRSGSLFSMVAVSQREDIPSRTISVRAAHEPACRIQTTNLTSHHVRTRYIPYPKARDPRVARVCVCNTHMLQMLGSPVLYPSVPFPPNHIIHSRCRNYGKGHSIGARGGEREAIAGGEERRRGA